MVYLAHGVVGMKCACSQDPCIITNVSGYEPYEKMKTAGGNIVWPHNFQIPANSSDDDGSMLGYVSS